MLISWMQSNENWKNVNFSHGHQCHKVVQGFRLAHPDREDLQQLDPTVLQVVHQVSTDLHQHLSPPQQLYHQIRIPWPRNQDL